MGCSSSATKYDYDIVIIGAGSGGLTAASFAAGLGARVALVDKSRLGGDCTWTGCVPSKALLHVAKIAHHARTGGGKGTGVYTEEGGVRVDMAKVRDYVHGRINAVYQHETPDILRAKGVDVMDMTTATFVDPHTVRLTPTPAENKDEGKGEGDEAEGKGRGGDGAPRGGSETRLAGEGAAAAKEVREVSAAFFCLCTGASPIIPPVEGLQDVPYITYEQVFDVDVLPKRLCVIGAGPIGAEMAQAFARLGSKVTMVASKLLRKEHDDARAVIASTFEEEGIDVVEGRAARVTKSSSVGGDGGESGKFKEGKEGNKEGSEGKEGKEGEGNGDGDDINNSRSNCNSKKGGPVYTVTAKNGQEVECDLLLVSAGRTPNVDGLGLDTIGVAVGPQRGSGITVNRSLQTSVPHIYAAGDCCGSEQFTHYAGWQAFQAVRNALLPGSANGHSDLVPRCTFTDPELAHVGMSLEEAKAKYGGGNAVVQLRRKAPKNDRAVCDSDALTKDAEGYISVVVLAKSGRVLGGSIVMARAGELINEIALAVQNKLTIKQIASTIHAYPSYGFALQQLAADYATKVFLASSTGNCARSWSLCCGTFSPKGPRRHMVNSSAQGEAGAGGHE